MALPLKGVAASRGKEKRRPEGRRSWKCVFAVLAAGIVAEITATIVAAIFETAPVMAAVAAMAAAIFAPDVVAVNPTAPSSVARDPNHFVVTRPIARAVIVVRPVAKLDADALGLNNGHRD
jgi:hypothetical protein